MSLLQVEGLGISFGGVTAVNDVSFALDQGKIVSVIGPNGAGKTTLFNMISGVYLPKSGKVRLDGEDVTGLRPDLLAVRGMSRTFQNLQIFQEMSVLENVIVGFHMHERGPVLADLFALPGSRKRARAAANTILSRIAAEEEARTIREIRAPALGDRQLSEVGERFGAQHFQRADADAQVLVHA
ncbi:ATP-binding cassette domain-containing protein, partial [Xanthobacter sp.]|uniref:ATP-binding cassette domain-containing protein n=1 Tax=Xanthobacter sp. TaxID=35809 RepID=UPI0035B36D97